MDFYRSEKNVAEANVLDRLSNLTLSVVSELEDRLENAPEDLKRLRFARLTRSARRC